MYKANHFILISEKIIVASTGISLQLKNHRLEQIEILRDFTTFGFFFCPPRLLCSILQPIQSQGERGHAALLN